MQGVTERVGLNSLGLLSQGDEFEATTHSKKCNCMVPKFYTGSALSVTVQCTEKIGAIHMVVAVAVKRPWSAGASFLAVWVLNKM